MEAPMGFLRAYSDSIPQATGLRRHHINNKRSDFKHTRRPRLVQTEALFDEDGCLTLQE